MGLDDKKDGLSVADTPSIIEEEKKRIAFLENVIKGIYQTKVLIDENGKVDMKISTKELKELISAENELMIMKRRIYGI